jgi:hypothetical protein
VEVQHYRKRPVAARLEDRCDLSAPIGSAALRPPGDTGQCGADWRVGRGPSVSSGRGSRERALCWRCGRGGCCARRGGRWCLTTRCAGATADYERSDRYVTQSHVTSTCRLSRQGGDRVLPPNVA